jgi:hypothetical protein
MQKKFVAGDNLARDYSADRTHYSEHAHSYIVAKIEEDKPEDNVDRTYRLHRRQSPLIALAT